MSHLSTVCIIMYFVCPTNNTLVYIKEITYVRHALMEGICATFFPMITLYEEMSMNINITGNQFIIELVNINIRPPGMVK